MTQTQDLNTMAAQFNVDPGALKCLIQFLGDNLAKPEAAEKFAQATDAQRDEIIKQGVKAWHNHSTRMLADLLENRTEWAQATRKQIASDVWHQARAQGASA
jgi:DNA polymerase II large subunit